MLSYYQMVAPRVRRWLQANTVLWHNTDTILQLYTKYPKHIFLWGPRNSEAQICWVLRVTAHMSIHSNL
jgi:hypothetical protein